MERRTIDNDRGGVDARPLVCYSPAMATVPTRIRRSGTTLTALVLIGITALTLSYERVSERWGVATQSGIVRSEADLGALQTASRLVVEGNWRVVIDGDRAFRVDPNGAPFVTQDGDTVTLEAPDGVRRHNVVLPIAAISEIEIDGAGSVEISGLAGPTLLVRVDGAASVEADDVVLERLEIIADGAASIDFSDAEVTNADVTIDGAANVELNLAGGELRGAINGLGRIRYDGTVSSQSVSIDGLGSVEGP